MGILLSTYMYTLKSGDIKAKYKAPADTYLSHQVFL